MFALFVLPGVSLGGDPLFIDENFDIQKFAPSDTPGGYESTDLGVTAARAYKDGAGAGASRAIVLSATFAGSTAESLAAIQYQNGAVTGSDSSNPAAALGANSNTIIQNGSYSANAGAGIPALTSGTSTIYLGNNAAGTAGFSGSLNDVRIYNSLLTVSQIDDVQA